MQIEKVSYTIDWRKMRKGYSFFVPCIDHRAAKKTFKQIAERLGMDFIYKVVIEEGVKGLRVWRV